jgi:hypothetical protein
LISAFGGNPDISRHHRMTEFDPSRHFATVN